MLTEPSRWTPRVTVAAIVYRHGRYLMVQEHTEHGLRYNQPAGHLESGESLVAACVRETLEETGFNLMPQSLLGTYLMHPRVPDGALAGAHSSPTYLRFAFIGEVESEVAAPTAQLDLGIVAVTWMSLAELAATRTSHRSPVVWQCVQDHQAVLSGTRATHALSCLTTLEG